LFRALFPHHTRLYYKIRGHKRSFSSSLRGGGAIILVSKIPSRHCFRIHSLRKKRLLIKLLSGANFGMYSLILSVLSGYAHLSYASVLSPKAVCIPDGCFMDVAGSNAPDTGTINSDCSSYFQLVPATETIASSYVLSDF
jgi:hypothetical protein